MKKIPKNLFSTMWRALGKVTVATLCMFSAICLCLLACEKPNPPNGGTTNPTDSIKHDISYWECEMSDDYPAYHVLISLSIDHTINRLYSTVTRTPMSTGIMWETGWRDYTISNDTIYYIRGYDQYIDDYITYKEPYPMWEITTFADTAMLLNAFPGIYPELVFKSYLFNRKE